MNSGNITYTPWLLNGMDADTGRAWVEVKNQFQIGDRLTLMSPQGNQSLQLQQLWDKQGTPISRAPGAGHRVQIELPAGMKAEFVLIIRDLPQAESAIAAAAEKDNAATAPETKVG